MTARIIDLLATTPVIGFGGERTVFPPEALSIPVVEADEVARWYWESEREVWDFESHFGPLQPPFDQMLITWRMPARCYVEGEWRNRAVDEMAAWVGGKRTDDGEGRAMVMCVLRRGRTLVALPLQEWFDLDAHGNYKGHHQTVSQALVDAKAAAGHGETWSEAHIPLLAISFMHCSNVKLVEVERRAKTPKGAKPGPMRRHTVIRLPSTVRRSERPDRTALGSVRSLHLVRGHFKTFTEDAPLFGSRVGTYWWNPATRGTADAGEVTHTYEVNPA